MTVHYTSTWCTLHKPVW